MNSKKSQGATPVLSRLAEVRERRGLTQAELAGAIGVEPAQISNIERGYRSPSIETAVALAEHLDVSLDFLLDRQKSSAVRNLVVERLVRIGERLTEQEVEVLARIANDLVKLREQRR
jgi:transcriptional regulator with XRE-family HTH domain